MDVPDEPLRPGAVIAGRFVLESKLGAGAFASVWRGTDRARVGRPLALKILHARHRRTPQVVERFAREAELLRQLVHPNIARAYTFHVDDATALIAIEYAPGRTLRAFLDRRSHADALLDAAELADLALPLMDALAYAHAAGVIHRDLKPANVIVSDASPPVPKLVDFGIAKDLGLAPDAQSTVGHWVGSVTYLTPEQICGAAVGARTDVFAMGAILFELATLRRMWVRGVDGLPLRAPRGPLTLDGVNEPAAVMRRIATEARPRVALHRPDLSPALDAIVARACAVEPATRFPDVASMAAALRAALGRRVATSPVSRAAGRVDGAAPTRSIEVWTDAADQVEDERPTSGSHAVVDDAIDEPTRRIATGQPGAAASRPPTPPLSLHETRVVRRDAAETRLELPQRPQPQPARRIGAGPPRVPPRSVLASAPQSLGADDEPLMPASSSSYPRPREPDPSPRAEATPRPWSTPRWIVLAVLSLVVVVVHVGLWRMSDRDPLVFTPALALLSCALIARGLLEQVGHRRVRALVDALLVDATPGLRWRSVELDDEGYLLAAELARSGSPLEVLALALPGAPIWRCGCGPIRMRVTWALPATSPLVGSGCRVIGLTDLLALVPNAPSVALELLRADQRVLAERGVRAAELDGARLAVMFESAGDDPAAVLRVAGAAVRLFRAAAAAASTSAGH